MEKLVIDRSKWRCGDHGRGDSRLLNKDGFMCCLGFECARRGVPETDLLDKFYPCGEGLAGSGLVNEKRPYVYTCWSVIAGFINDDGSFSDEDRERSIARHFSIIGVEVEFIGEYGD